MNSSTVLVLVGGAMMFIGGVYAFLSPTRPAVRAWLRIDRRICGLAFGLLGLSWIVAPFSVGLRVTCLGVGAMILIVALVRGRWAA